MESRKWAQKLLPLPLGEKMPKLDIPDICAHLDRLKRLCDRLEKAQSDEQRYGELTAQIRAETNALHAMICSPPRQSVRRSLVGT